MRDEGRGWLETAAAADAADAPAARRAQLALGKALLLGSSDMPKDYARARTLLGEAAAQGDPAAAYYLGLIYRSGYGVAADPVQPRTGSTSRRADIPAADFMLANAYRGSGVPRDERALALYRRAAEHELPEAVQTLAMAYRNGELGQARRGRVPRAVDRDRACAEAPGRRAVTFVRTHRHPTGCMTRLPRRPRIDHPATESIEGRWRAPVALPPLAAPRRSFDTRHCINMQPHNKT